ncbi:MAG: aminoacyl-tRNA hydrolase [Opitutaceae bacterium]|nr:aminoacyl-tRNA hydrolase [Opitutaceae bacterium]
MSISLVAALGNPGREYADTRHNLGWLVLDAFARRENLAWRHAPRFESMVTEWRSADGRGVHLVKPLTYMNESGRALAALARYHKIPVPRIAVIHDEFTINLGLVKVSVTGSAGGHNGVASLLQHLGDGFVRYRLGIGPKEPQQMDLKDFVLGIFTPSQKSIIERTSACYLSGLDLLLNSGIDKAMNTLNRRDTNEPEQA